MAALSNVKVGAALGLTEAAVREYEVRFGEDVTALLLKLLEQQRTLGKQSLSAASTNVLQQLLLQFLLTYKTQIEQWVATGEGAIFDAVVSLVASQNAVLAAALEAFKTTVINDLDPAVANALDAVIALLQGNSSQ